jgi:hypothetical protein
MTGTPYSVLISGAGIAGPALAYWLSQTQTQTQTRARFEVTIPSVVSHLALRLVAVPRFGWEWPSVLGVEPPEPTQRWEIVWLEPYPDSRVEDFVDTRADPEARHERREAI